MYENSTKSTMNAPASVMASSLGQVGAADIERSQLEVVIYRIGYQANRVDELEKELYVLVERLNGDAAAPRGCSAGNGRAGLLGQAMGSLDDLESALSNCGDLLSTLRGLV